MLVLIGVAAAFRATFLPHMTKPSVASKRAETDQPDVCPPHWLPVLPAARPSHIDSPAPRFDEEALPFEDDNELLSMKRRMTETACVPMAELAVDRRHRIERGRRGRRGRGGRAARRRGRRCRGRRGRRR